jgi:hypothetical protein
MKYLKSLEALLSFVFIALWTLGVGIFVKNYAIEIYNGWSSPSYSRTCVQNIGDEYVRVDCGE